MKMIWDLLLQYHELLLDGLKTTLLLSLIPVPCALAIGVFLGYLASRSNGIVSELVAFYVNPMRNLPIALKLFFLYFVVGLEALPAGIIALTAHHSAYICDITAAGLRSIPKEQAEAAQACGHNQFQIFIYVLLPQIIAIVIPPLTSQFIDIVKNSSVCMLIGIRELTFETQEISHITFRGFEVATIVTVMYLMIALVIGSMMEAIRRAVFTR